jgi:hypothetical protein
VNALPNRVALTSAPLWCFKCCETDHSMVDCRNDDHYGKGLFIVDKEKFADNNLVDSKHGLTFHEENECEEYICEGLEMRVL